MLSEFERSRIEKRIEKSKRRIKKFVADAEKLGGSEKGKENLMKFQDEKDRMERLEGLIK